jgi:ADP-ribose pyrophosphatase
VLVPPFDSEDCLRRYLALAETRPAYFQNPPGDIYRILFDHPQVVRARAEAKRLRTAQGLTVSDLRVGVLAEDPYVTVLREAVEFPDGGYGLYNRLMLAKGVVVLPVLDDRLVLIKRFRHGTRAWHWEAPRGTVTSELEIEEDARRELQEEIGAQATALVDLGEYHPSAGIVSESMRLFFARIEGIGELDKHEAIVEMDILDRDRAEAMILSGEVTDGPTLAAYLQARLRGWV